MAPDRFREVTTTSWFGRIGESIKGILFGFVLIAGSGILIFWNEGRAVNRAKTLSEGAKAVITISAERVDPANEGKLVHLVSQATTTETLTDAEFGIATPALKLRRKAEMYQWKEQEKKETKKNTGGSSTTTTTTSYDKTWAESLIDSSRFKHPEGHKNPSAMIYSSREVTAQNITAGAFTLSRSLVNRIDSYADLPFTSAGQWPEAMRAKAKLNEGKAYFGADPHAPQIGDVRVSFAVVKPVTVSLVARQVKNSFESFISKSGGELELLEVGEFSAAELFRQAGQMNLLLTWGLRLGGLLLMWLGFALVFRPLSVLADVVPLFGNIVGFGTGLVALLLASLFSVLTAAVAWLFYRPVLSMILAVGVGALVGGIIWLKKRVAAPPRR